MSREKITVIGASAGGLAIISQILSRLPVDIPTAILIVLHISPESLGLLPEILQKHSKLSVRHPEQDEPICNGKVFVAPPDTHMLVHPHQKILLTHGPRINRSRPAIDPLFRSAAIAYGEYTTGIILTGMLDDGLWGLQL